MSSHRRITAVLMGKELVYTTSRSGGPGGQNVNKVNSKVTLQLDIMNSEVLTEEEKAIILQRLSTRLTSEGVLLLTSQESRSQLKNKETAVAKFDLLMEKAFAKRKARKKTRPSKGSVQDRIKKKKVHGEKKKWRRKPGSEGE